MENVLCVCCRSVRIERDKLHQKESEEKKICVCVRDRQLGEIGVWVGERFESV